MDFEEQKRQFEEERRMMRQRGGWGLWRGPGAAVASRHGRRVEWASFEQQKRQFEEERRRMRQEREQKNGRPASPLVSRG